MKEAGYGTQGFKVEVRDNGIGLTIVKDILQFHNADIEVESEAGRGTVFRVYFDTALC